MHALCHTGSQCLALGIMSVNSLGSQGSPGLHLHTLTGPLLVCKASPKSLLLQKPCILWPELRNWSLGWVRYLSNCSLWPNGCSVTPARSGGGPEAKARQVEEIRNGRRRGERWVWVHSHGDRLCFLLAPAAGSQSARMTPG